MIDESFFHIAESTEIVSVVKEEIKSKILKTAQRKTFAPNCIKNVNITWYYFHEHIEYGFSRSISRQGFNDIEDNYTLLLRQIRRPFMTTFLSLSVNLLTRLR